MIVHGYRSAAEKAQEILQGFAIDVKPQDISILKKIAETAMSGKGVESARSQLCDIVAEAVTLLADKKGMVDVKDIKVEKKIGGEIEDSEIIRGVVIDKERVHPGMPKKVEKAKIML
jgi:chaperonin GroEL (HSP60 family)